jgi:hypothetical protein
MNSDSVAIFMLGIIVGQWLGVLVSLKVIRAMVKQDGRIPAYALEKSEDPSPLGRLIYRQLFGAAQPVGILAKRAPPAKKKRRTKTR